MSKASDSFSAGCFGAVGVMFGLAMLMLLTTGVLFLFCAGMGSPR